MHFKLILITPEEDIKGESGLINVLFENGLPLLHIRKPAYGIEQIKKLLNAISADFYSKIVVHHHYELLQEYNLKGIHLPEKARRENNSATVKNIVSTSFHSVEDMVHEKMNFEYAFLSPVFPSISKKGYEPSIELPKIAEFLKQDSSIPFPIIALGGITDKNIFEVKNAGFAGAAFIGHVWQSTNPIERLTSLLKITGDN